MADSSTNDQLIKMHSTHSWIKIRDNRKSWKHENEAVIFVECRDFAKMAWFYVFKFLQ